MTIQELRKKIEDREVMCGTLACIPDPAVTETMALSGAEMLWIDMEHTPVSVDKVQNMLIASRSGNVPAFVRIPWNDPVLAKPVLDMGPEGIIFPCIRTKEEAELAVSACKYPPRGVRGYGPMRASDYGKVSQMDYISDKNKETVVAVQIEHIDAVDNLEEIVKTDGIDLYIFGPNDLSGSVGLLGQVKDQKLLELYEKSVSVFKKYNKPFGVATYFNPQWIEYWKKLGCTMFFIGCDYAFLGSGVKNMVSDFKKI